VSARSFSYEGPHTHDVELAPLLPIVYGPRVGGHAGERRIERNNPAKARNSSSGRSASSVWRRRGRECIRDSLRFTGRA